VTFLLDVNVLIALIDPAHTQHAAAHGWLETVGTGSWATCPIVENGAVRILSHPRYPFGPAPASPSGVARILKRLRQVPGHRFWPDDISLLDDEAVDLAALIHSRQITDTYLLALAASKGGRLATFDGRLTTNAVRGGAEALLLLQTA